MRLFIILPILVLLAGCWESRTESEKQTDTKVTEARQLTVSGTVQTQAGALPIQFTLDWSGGTTASAVERGTSDTKSQIDGAAIGRQIAAAITPLLSGAVKVAGGGIDWVSLLTAGGAGLAGLATAYGVKQRHAQNKQVKT